MRDLEDETADEPVQVRRRLVAALPALVVGVGAATALTAERADADTLHPLVGAWEVAVTHPPGEPAPPGITVNPGTFLFTDDGGVVWSGIAPVTGSGRWRSLSGNGAFEYVFRAAVTQSDPTQPLGFRYVGMLHVRQSGTVSGDRYTASGQGVQYAPDGTTVLFTSRSNTTGARITVATG
jgi:hypothetical protein